MNILAVDTALGACSAAVLHDGRTTLLSDPMTRGHQERLAVMVEAAMVQADLAFAALDRVGVTVGPGSFTGVRVGVAFAKGLAAALSIPCIGVTTLEALAAEAGEGAVLAVVDGRRDQVYVQAFDGGKPSGDPSALSLDAARDLALDAFGTTPFRLIGTGAAMLAPLLPTAEVVMRDAASAASVLMAVASKPTEGSPAQPVYLRAPDAKTLAERSA